MKMYFAFVSINGKVINYDPDNDDNNKKVVYATKV